MKLIFNNCDLVLQTSAPITYSGAEAFCRLGWYKAEDHGVFNATPDLEYFRTTDYLRIYGESFTVFANMGNPFGLGVAFFSDQNDESYISLIYGVLPDTLSNAQYTVSKTLIPSNARYICVGAYSNTTSPGVPNIEDCYVTI